MAKLLGVALVSVRRKNPRKVSWTIHETQTKADRECRMHKQTGTQWRFMYRVNVYAKATHDTGRGACLAGEVQREAAS